MKTLSSVLFIVVMLSGCSASGPIYKVYENGAIEKAVVYIYRPWRLLDGAGWANIHINGTKEFALRNEGYGVVVLDPGSYDIRADGNMFLTNWRSRPVTLTLLVEANKEYYVRLLPEADDVLFAGSVTAVSSHANFSILSKEKALKDIIKTRRVK